MPSYCTSFVRLQIDDQTWNSISLVLFLFLSCEMFAKGTLLRNKFSFKAIFQTPNTALISLLISKESQRDRPTHPPKNNNLNKTIVKASRISSTSAGHLGTTTPPLSSPTRFHTHTQPRLQVDASESIGRWPVKHRNGKPGQCKCHQNRIGDTPEATTTLSPSSREHRETQSWYFWDPPIVSEATLQIRHYHR